MDDERLGVGGNQPPPETNPLRDRLAEQAAAVIKRRDELLASVARCPSEVPDEETCGKIADLVKLLMACHKNAEGMRIKDKEPFLESSRIVDGFYRQITDPLDRAKRDIESRLTTYQRRKAEDERRRREETERLAREEADRARKEAEAKAAAMTTQAALDDAVSAEALARQAAADAEKAAKEAGAKAAEMSRTRGDLGSVASLRTFWDVADLDRNTLDLESIRAHISIDALEKAVRAFVRAGGRKLTGARIFENTSTQVR